MTADDCFVSDSESEGNHRKPIEERTRIKMEVLERNVSGPKYLTYGEAADFLRCSEKTLYNRVRDGKIRPIRNGRLVLFTVELLTEYLQRENELTV